MHRGVVVLCLPAAAACVAAALAGASALTYPGTNGRLAFRSPRQQCRCPLRDGERDGDEAFDVDESVRRVPVLVA